MPTITASTRVEDVVAAQRKTTAEANVPDWWARRFAEITLRHNAEQKSRWSEVQDKVGTMFKAMTETMTRDELKRWGATPDGRLWNALRGHDVRIGDVYIGARAVAGSSLRWWQDLQGEFAKALAALPEDAAQRELWQGALQLIAEEIVPPLRRDLEAGLERGEWWLRAFEAINYRNYESPEWWAKEYGRPFAGWPAARARIAHAAYELAEQQIGTASSLGHVQAALTTFTARFNTVKGIETSEREDLGLAVQQLAQLPAALSLKLTDEQAQQWFDENRDY